MTPAERHLFDVLGEECAEIIQRISKAQRFGINEVQPGQPLTNRERIVGEINDLIGTVELLQETNALPVQIIDRKLVEAKKVKVRRFMDYARDVGALPDHCPRHPDGRHQVMAMSRPPKCVCGKTIYPSAP